MCREWPGKIVQYGTKYNTGKKSSKAVTKSMSHVDHVVSKLADEQPEKPQSTLNHQMLSPLRLTGVTECEGARR